MNKLVKVEEAAEFFGVCKQTLYGHFERGLIPGYKLGKALRFDIEELKDFFRQQTITQTKE